VNEVDVNSGPPKVQRGWQLLWFVPHLAAMYLIVNFCTPWLAGWIQATLLPFLLHRPSSSSRFEFLLTYLFALSFVPAFLVGLSSTRFRHRAAEFVWVVPAMILGYKFITFSAATSVLQSQAWSGSSAFHQYFGGNFLIQEFHDWHALRNIAGSNADMTRGLAQIMFIAPFCAGVGYSVATWIGLRTDIYRELEKKLTNWHKSKSEEPTL